MIYLDNAATGGFKINAVTEITNTVIKFLCANPGRSGHRLSSTGAELVFSTRELIAKTFGGESERVVFTKNCTEALNTAIFGYKNSYRKILTSVYEHNSVLRPLNFLKTNGKAQVEVVSDKDEDLFSAFCKRIDSSVDLVVLSAVSNVTGKVLPFREIANVCKKHNVKILIDGAQAGGHLPLSIKNDGISMLALAGHKGLYGIMGTGVLLFSEDVSLTPLCFGGTGTETNNELFPSTYPEKLEAGTLNLPGIASLYEGVKYVSNNLNNFNELLFSVTKRVIEALSEIKGITIYSVANPVGIVAFSIDNLASTLAEEILNTEFDIAVRGGLHCAPLLHKRLNTDGDGLIRASFSPQNTSSEINAFILAIKKLSKRLNP